MRINDMVRASFQKEQASKIPTADDSNFSASGRDPLMRASHPNARRIIPISDEIKAAIAEDARISYTQRNGMTDRENRIVDVENAYLATLPREDRAAAAWTLNQFNFDISSKYEAEIRKHIPT